MSHQLIVLLGAALAAVSSPVRAEVAASSDSGFVSHNEVLVDTAPAEAWAAMVQPGQWWNDAHTYSGNAANMTLEAKAGGCFCETIPGSGGAIEHMRVIYVAPGTALRMSGGLGPLQPEAVTGVLTMTLAPEGGMTRISWDYVVGGYARMPLADLAPLVDQVVGEQLLRLAARLGRIVDPAARRP
jgi:uncharacterized protein YndB with AHSA1/START domain